jgi:glycine/D-amino acid oxidase-like deaminating enzyme
LSHAHDGRRYDAIIVGAGIVGAACAAALAETGMRLAVIEPGEIGGGATSAGMGHIVLMDDSPAQFALTHYARSLWAALAAVLPRGVEYDRTGTLWIAADAEEMDQVHRKQALYREQGAEARILDARALAEAEPNLRAGLAGALLVPDDAVLYPPCAAAYLLGCAIQQGAELLCGCRAIRAQAGEVRLSDGATLRAPHLVNAAGVASPSLDPSLPVRARKGHLVITDRYPGYVRHQLVELGYLRSAHSISADSVAFNVQPRRTGQLLIGSSRQFGDEDSAARPETLRAMLDRAGAYMPGVQTLSAIRVWTGLRAATPDKLPLIGPDPRDSTVLLATGHEGLGITTSLATARLLTDHLLGRETAIPIAPYLPARFASTPATFHA